MIFDEVVQKAVEETNGGIAAVIMASDGISITQYVKPEKNIDLETLGIEYANLLAEIAKHTEAMEAGSVKEVCLKTDNFLSVIRVLTSEYFIALILQKDGNLGKGRFILRVNAPALLKEL